MAQTIRLLVETGKQDAKKTFDVTQGSGDKGSPVRVKAVKNAQYKFEDLANKNRGPSNLSTKRVGRNLHVILDGSKEADLIIEGYYDEAIDKSERGGLFGRAEDGRLYEYIPEDASSKNVISALSDGGAPVSQVLGASQAADIGLAALPTAAAAGFSWLTFAASLIGAAALGGGKGGGSGAGAAAGGGSSGANSGGGAAPAAPTTAPVMSAASDTGASATDCNTSNSKPQFDIGTTMPAGVTPQLVVDGVVVPSTLSGPDGSGHYHLTPVNAIADGNHTVAINYINAAGKPSANGPSLPVVIETVAPTLTVNTIAGDDAISAAEAQGPITVSGTTSAQVGQRVKIEMHDGNSVKAYEATVQAGINGGANTFSVQIPQIDLPASNGAYKISAEVTSLAGNTASVERPFKLDTTAPVLSITSIAADTVNDSTTLNGTFDAAERGSLAGSSVTTRPVISGTTDAEAGQTVTVAINNVSHTATVVAGAGGVNTWSLTLSNADALALNHGNTYSVTASVRDAAGNSGADTNNGLRVNIAPPDIPTVTQKYAGTTTPIIAGTAQKEDVAAPGTLTSHARVVGIAVVGHDQDHADVTGSRRGGLHGPYRVANLGQGSCFKHAVGHADVTLCQGAGLDGLRESESEGHLGEVRHEGGTLVISDDDFGWCRSYKSVVNRRRAGHRCVIDTHNLHDTVCRIGHCRIVARTGFNGCFDGVAAHGQGVGLIVKRPAARAINRDQ